MPSPAGCRPPGIETRLRPPRRPEIRRRAWESPPTRGRGLKRTRLLRAASAGESPPTRGRGLKLHLAREHGPPAQVAPHAGARIETGTHSCYRRPQSVAPHAGARIETPTARAGSSPATVAPHAGARIETNMGWGSGLSPPTRGRGWCEALDGRPPDAGARIETVRRARAGVVHHGRPPRGGAD